MNKNNKPEIRFKGFTDAWEQRKLEDMCSLITKQTGFDYSATIKPSLVKSKDENTYSFIQNKDFEGMNINLDTDFYIPVDVAEKYPKITLDQPSLLISISGKIGNVGLYSLNKNAFIGGAVGICKLKNIEDGKTALYELLAPTGQKYFELLVKASSHANITVEDIRNIVVHLPQNEEEKKKINNYFEELDNLITLHLCKLEKLQKIKESLLEKMFPKDGNSLPEIRFKGFTDAWKQCKFGDLGSVAMCKRIFKEQTTESGDVPFFKIGTFGGEPDAYISRELFEEYKEKFNYPEVGDTLISASGTIGRTVEYTGEDEYFQDSNIVWFKHDDRVDNTYLKCVYSFVKWAGIEGSTIKRLYNDNFLKTEFSIPNIDEQRKIGEYFARLDTLITLHQRKLEKLKIIKKSMLEKMFVK